MGKLLENLHVTLLIGLVAAIGLMMGFHAETITESAVLQWLHVFFAITWIGLLYYFNFVQIRVMPNVPAELKPAVSKHIAPEALFWFRWSALFTVLAGIGVLITRGHDYASEVLTFGLVNGYVRGEGGGVAASVDLSRAGQDRLGAPGAVTEPEVEEEQSQILPYHLGDAVDESGVEDDHGAGAGQT